MKPLTTYDAIRIIGNITGFLAMWFFSMLPEIYAWGRGAKGFSNLLDSPLTPAGPAFAIWSVIFLLCAAYTLMQALGSNRTRLVFQRTGHLTAIAFWVTAGWSITANFIPFETARPLSALLFLPITYGLIRAMLSFYKYSNDLDRSELWATRLPIALMAGWTSLAGFVNFAALITIPAPLFLLLCICFIGVIIFIASEAIWPYGLAAIWGLAWLFIAKPEFSLIIFLGISGLLGLLVFKQKQLRNYV